MFLFYHTASSTFGGILVIKTIAGQLNLQVNIQKHVSQSCYC